MELQFNKLTQETLDLIRQNTDKLTRLLLYLDESPSDEAIEQLIEILKNTKNLRNFGIWQTDRKLFELVTALEGNTNLETLSCWRGDMNDETATNIAGFLESHFEKLLFLDFSFNPIHLNALERLYAVMHQKFPHQTLKEFKRESEGEKPELKKLFNRINALFPDVITFEEARKNSSFVENLLFQSNVINISDKGYKYYLLQHTILKFRDGPIAKKDIDRVFDEFFDDVCHWRYSDKCKQNGYESHASMMMHQIHITREEASRFCKEHQNENIDIKNLITADDAYDKRHRPPRRGCTIS